MVSNGAATADDIRHQRKSSKTGIGNADVSAGDAADRAVTFR